MEELDKAFIEYCEAGFRKYVSDVYVNLRKNNQEYQNLLEKKEEILNHFQNLRDIFECRVSMKLTNDEISELINIIDIDDHIRYLEEKELFLNGMKESYKILRKLEMIKD